MLIVFLLSTFFLSDLKISNRFLEIDQKLQTLQIDEFNLELNHAQNFYSVISRERNYLI